MRKTVKIMDVWREENGDRRGDWGWQEGRGEAQSQERLYSVLCDDPHGKRIGKSGYTCMHT